MAERRARRARRTLLRADFLEDEYARLVRRMARLERIVSEQVRAEADSGKTTSSGTHYNRSARTGVRAP